MVAVSSSSGAYPLSQGFRDFAASYSKVHRRNDGQTPVVNSRDLAERFEIRHDNVLRDIDLLTGSSDLRSLSNQGVSPFREITAFDSKANREIRSFDLTRDGFTLLVMGWTGEKAMAFKVVLLMPWSTSRYRRSAWLSKSGWPCTSGGYPVPRSYRL